MSWRDWRNKISFRSKKEIPEDVFVRCEGCLKSIYRKRKEEEMEVCYECDYHFYLCTQKRLDMLFDPGTFREMFEEVSPTDPLNFVDREPYPDRLTRYQEGTGLTDAIVVGTGEIEGQKTCLGLMDSAFMAGSMGSVVGEKVTRITECALEERIPLILISTSGGARMQEGALSLMQMAKTCCALARLKEAGLMFLSVLTNPTTAGVLASFAGVGDVIIAEPKALIGFTGPRVIKETIKQDLPPGFQRSEFLLDHGLIDMIVHRQNLRQRIADLLSYGPGGKSPSPGSFVEEAEDAPQEADSPTPPETEEVDSVEPEEGGLPEIETANLPKIEESDLPESDEFRLADTKQAAPSESAEAVPEETDETGPEEGERNGDGDPEEPDDRPES